MGGCQSNDADIERRAREEKNKYIEVFFFFFFFFFFSFFFFFFEVFFEVFLSHPFFLLLIERPFSRFSLHCRRGQSPSSWYVVFNSSFIKIHNNIFNNTQKLIIFISFSISFPQKILTQNLPLSQLFCFLRTGRKW